MPGWGSPDRLDRPEEMLAGLLVAIGALGVFFLEPRFFLTSPIVLCWVQ